MITDNQTRRLLRGAALSAALLLMAAPAALADPQGYRSMDFSSTAPAIVNRDIPLPSRNAPKPDACWLSSHETFADFDARRPPSNIPAVPTSSNAGQGGANVDN
jgi:hypothetical protein